MIKFKLEVEFYGEEVSSPKACMIMNSDIKDEENPIYNHTSNKIIFGKEAFDAMEEFGKVILKLTEEA